MGRFRSSQSQANYAVSQKLAIGKPSHGKEREDGRIHSIGTARTYSASLKGVAAFIAERKLDSTGKGLASLTLEMANTYLEFRAQEVSQKQLNKDRQAMQILLGEKLAVTKSELEQALESRAYTQAQVQLIAGAQTKTHSLPTLIAADAGLRAHELLTLLPSKERGASSHRIWTNERFEGRKNVKRYSVVGKGGLIREVAIVKELADQLELLRLYEPRTVTDRGIHYVQYYNIGGGKRWSGSFSKAAQRELGWSTGAHGVRHTYAQARMRLLQELGYIYEAALAIVSQEMGHFRSTITEVYLR
jgi:integrase